MMMIDYLKQTHLSQRKVSLTVDIKKLMVYIERNIDFDISTSADFSNWFYYYISLAYT